MYSTLTFGSIALPTAPFFALIAWLVGVEIAGRFGKHVNLDLNTIWNMGLIATIVGLIAARFWNIVRFWAVYSAEPLLIFSPRPSGFDLLPGLIVALIAAYAYLIYKALDPLDMFAATSVGITAAMIVLAVSDFLTGAVVGTATQLPWAANYFGKSVHPVALYRGLGFFALLVALAIFLKRITGNNTQRGNNHNKAQTLLLSTILGGALIRLIADGFVENADTLAGFRISQIVALLAALVATLLLARTVFGPHSSEATTPDADTTVAI